MNDSNVTLPDVSLQALLDAGLHFGHQTKRWNPKMLPYIFGERNGIYIVDLTKSLEQIREAQKFVYDTVARGRSILFVGTKRQAQDPIRDVASKLKQPYVVHRWLGGMLTNNTTIRGSVKRMRQLAKQEEDGTLDALSSKKESSKLRREYTKLNRNLSGIADMEKMPGAIVIVDVTRETIAVAEAKRLGIPVVALVDTNANPTDVEIPIPGNDDGSRAIQLVVSLLGDTIQIAHNEYAQRAAEENRKRALEDAEKEKARAVAETERKAAAVEEEAARQKAVEAARQKEEASQAESKRNLEAQVAAEKQAAKEVAAAKLVAEEEDARKAAEAAAAAEAASEAAAPAAGAAAAGAAAAGVVAAGAAAAGATEAGDADAEKAAAAEAEKAAAAEAEKAAAAEAEKAAAAEAEKAAAAEAEKAAAAEAEKAAAAEAEKAAAAAETEKAAAAAEAEKAAAEEPAAPAVEKPDASVYENVQKEFEGEAVKLDDNLGILYTEAPANADDLTKISGVGPVLAEKLNESGVYTYKQIANWNEYNVQEFDSHLSFPGRIGREEWIKQAKELVAQSGSSDSAGASSDAEPAAEEVAKQFEGESVKVDEKLGVLYTEAPADADDLTQLSGVGPKLSEKLNEFGVYKIKQIANWSRANVEEFDEQLSFPGRIDREEWIKQAKAHEAGK